MVQGIDKLAVKEGHEAVIQEKKNIILLCKRDSGQQKHKSAYVCGGSRPADNPATSLPAGKEGGKGGKEGGSRERVA